MNRLSEDTITSRLDEACARHLDVTGRVENVRRLSGGASREMWSFDVADPDSETRSGFVLRRDPSGGAVSAMLGAAEARLLEAAHAARVPVPTVRFVLTEDDALGPGYVMDRVEGETIPRKILRDDAFAQARPILAARCGETLARIHAIDTAKLPALPALDPDVHPARAQIEQYRGVLDGFRQPHPAFELGLRWLEDHLPPPGQPGLVHGDFRNGNLMVGPDGLRAVLDWELAHVGDPMEDLGWLCIRSWRFGHDDKPVGGFGSREQLFEAYENAGGRPVDPEIVRFWEVFGNLKWGEICIVQAFSHLNGLRRSVELAALGRRVCEMEYDLLNLID